MLTFSDDMLNLLNTTVSHEASIAMPVAVADTFMHQSPAERQRTIPSLQAIEINDGNVDHLIQYKDGSLTITNQATGQSMELGAFYEAFVKDEKENVFQVQTLNETQKTIIKQYLTPFQEELGSEILRSLHRIA